MNYPADCTTNNDKIEWLRIHMKKLTLYHNKVAKWYKNGGVTQEQYDAQPAVVKENFDYEPKLSAANWQRFLSDHYNVRVNLVVDELSRIKSEMGNSVRWSAEVS